MWTCLLSHTRTMVCSGRHEARTYSMGGTHIWKWRMSATKRLRCRGLLVTNCIKKGGLLVTKRTKKGVFQWNSSKNRGFQGQKFLNITSNLSKFSKNQFFFCGKLSLIWLLNAKMRGLWVTKMCQGFSVTGSLSKIWCHWVKVGKNGGLSVKASKKK